MSYKIIRKLTLLLTIFGTVLLMSNSAVANDEPGSFAEECQVVYDTTGFIWPGCEDLIDFGDTDPAVDPSCKSNGDGCPGTRCRKNPELCVPD